MMGIFGWSYPAGCDGPPDDDAICEVCGIEAGSCTCPVCPVCGVQGDPRCYEEHGLERTITPIYYSPVNDSAGNGDVLQ